MWVRSVSDVSDVMDNEFSRWMMSIGPDLLVDINV